MFYFWNRLSTFTQVASERDRRRLCCIMMLCDLSCSLSCMLLYLEARSKKTSSKGSTKITSIKHFLNDIEVFSIIHFETEKKKLNKYQFFLASISIDLAIGFKRAAGQGRVLFRGQNYNLRSASNPAASA